MKKDNKLQIVRDYERLILENADLRYFNQLYEQRMGTLEKRCQILAEELRRAREQLNETRIFRNI